LAIKARQSSFLDFFGKRIGQLIGTAPLTGPESYYAPALFKFVPDPEIQQLLQIQASVFTRKTLHIKVYCVKVIVQDKNRPPSLNTLEIILQRRADVFH